jgi:hypothetical protein
LPGKGCRTIAIAHAMPKMVFAGTTIAVIRIVIRNACFASGVVTDSQADPTPSSNARPKTIATGRTSSSAR